MHQQRHPYLQPHLGISIGLQNSKPQELELEVLGTNNAYPAIQKTLKLRQW